MIDAKQAVFERSHGMCEAGLDGCGQYADHVHHALTRARGGNLLDGHTTTHLAAERAEAEFVRTGPVVRP